MSAVMKLIRSWLCPSPTISSRASANRRADSGGHRPESPIVLAEIVAASCFLDFGGVPDARYFHTLYEKRLSEAERDTVNKRSYKDGCLPRQLIPGARKDISKDDPIEEQTFRSQEAAGKMLPKIAK